MSVKTECTGDWAGSFAPNRSRRARASALVSPIGSGVVSTGHLLGKTNTLRASAFPGWIWFIGSALQTSAAADGEVA